MCVCVCIWSIRWRWFCLIVQNQSISQCAMWKIFRCKSFLFNRKISFLYVTLCACKFSSSIYKFNFVDSVYSIGYNKLYGLSGVINIILVGWLFFFFCYIPTIRSLNQKKKKIKYKTLEWQRNSVTCRSIHLDSMKDSNRFIINLFPSLNWSKSKLKLMLMSFLYWFKDTE